MMLYSAPPSYYSMIARLALLESGLFFDIRQMDIHMKKDQLSSWYQDINPAMTVPTLVDKTNVYTSSRTILAMCATHAGNQWCDNTPHLAKPIQDIVAAHYAISIEHLTFSKAMTKIPPLRIVFPRMLQGIIGKLEKELPASLNPTATKAKITLNQERLAYFTEGNLSIKLMSERDNIQRYLDRLPAPMDLLFGEHISSADMVTAILFARLHMIGEYDLVKTIPALMQWFERMQARQTFKKADIWLRFHPLRIFFMRLQ